MLVSSRADIGFRWLGTFVFSSSDCIKTFVEGHLES